MSTTGSARSVPTGATRVAAVIGDPVRHSRSPVIMNAAFAAADLDWIYVAFEVGDGRVPDALAGMRALGIEGLSVTMPHKAAAAAAVDECSEDARLLGAVNCVVNRHGVLTGHNTDGAGFLAALAGQVGVVPEGLACAVVGAGGAARSVVQALARAGASEVTVVNRTAGRAEAAADLAGRAGRVVAPADAAQVLSEAVLVINATSVGMGEGPGGAVPFDPAVLHPGQWVVDLVYEPLRTPLLVAAEARGATAVDGLGMLVGQAAVAFELWTGTPAPVAVMATAARATLP